MESVIWKYKQQAQLLSLAPSGFGIIQVSTIVRPIS